ncbi:MAG TPA: tetratricopeptide repeat protein, partial [Saprospiraceae bacterium]|nr:tetratricopeptide repeat protein [Saprospiraceae bacterium]
DAKQKIDAALQTAEAQAMASAWLTKGDIYNTIVQRDMARRSFDPNAPLTGENDALEAFNAYSKVLESATAKSYDKKDALKGISEVQAHLVNIGVTKFEAAQYDKSFLSSEAAVKSHELLLANSQKSLLDAPGKLDDQVYFTALAAQYAKKNAEAIAYYERLYKKGSDKPEIYEGLFQIKSEAGDKEGAKKILAEGIAKFPDNTGLLFAQINIYLQEGKLDELVTSLKKAIEKEPGNASLYVNLGRVYDDLQTRETAAKNEAKATEYFNLAMKYYKESTERDPKSPDGHYMMGAMYYNKAAALTTEMNNTDNSAAGLKRFKQLSDQMIAYFDQALPHFQHAESLECNDLNTLIALKEIYARKEDELSLEFKKRLEVVQGGGKNSAPFFKK